MRKAAEAALSRRAPPTRRTSEVGNRLSPIERRQWAQSGRYWTFCLHVRDRLNERLFSTSVALRSAKWEEGSIGPDFVDRRGDHRTSLVPEGLREEGLTVDVRDPRWGELEAGGPAWPLDVPHRWAASLKLRLSSV